MDDVYVLTIHFMNGAFTQWEDITVFDSYALAEKTSEAVKTENPSEAVITEIKKVPLYKEENDVPILNDLYNKS